MQEIDLFQDLKTKISNIDPVKFCENYLKIDGEKFMLSGTGYKPFADIYRYIGIKALEKNSKPIVFVKGRQVGGTTMALALEMYFMGCNLFGKGKPPIRIIHAFPSLEQAARYTKSKLDPMIGDSKTIGTSKKGKPLSYMESLLDSNQVGDSLKFKRFSDGNYMWIESTGVDADRIRGLSADIIFFDEVQDTPGAAISNATKILHASKYGRPTKGVQVYFGTPKKKGSDFHKIWLKSNQQFFHLGCEKCGKFFPLYAPESDEWEKIWIDDQIVKCMHCNHLQDKLEATERGKWVETVPLEDCDYIGFHINQLFSPKARKEDIIYEKPQNHATNTERAYRNEVLGDFYQGDSTPITIEEIMLKCGDMDRKISKSSDPEGLYFLGIDYGLKADLEQQAKPEKKQSGQSYSTAVVLKAIPGNLLSIEFAMKFKKADPAYMKEVIDELMTNYSIKISVGDIGFSHYFSTELFQKYGGKYIVSMAAPKIQNPLRVKYNEDMVPRQISFERDFYIGEMFENMKSGKIRFPYGDYEKISWLIQHCASMEVKPKLSETGEHRIHYVKGSVPNDGFMALTNAYLAYKFFVTSAFTDNSIITSSSDFSIQKKQPSAVLAYFKK